MNLAPIVRWFDAWAPSDNHEDEDEGSKKVDWARVLPFLALHASLGLVVVVGWSPFAVAFAIAFYCVRMFAITAFYHRYFSHRAFRASRPVQFAFACLGAMAVQRGPLWWAAHHRAHHSTSDREADIHSPERHGFWWSHVGWILSRGSFRTRIELIRDFAKFPELRFLDRFDSVVPLALIPAIYALGAWLESAAPSLGTNGLQLLVWGFSASTVALYHCTFSINSLAHRLGRRRFETRDESRNNFALALITFGEGWHNNHHHYPASARQGFRWWEVDLTYYALCLLNWLGVVHDLRPIPAQLSKAGTATKARGSLR